MTELKALKILKKASSESAKENFIKSISLCKKVINLSPDSTHAYKLLATNLMQLRRFSEAESAIKKTIILLDDEDEITMHHLLGCLYNESGQRLKSLNLLESLFNRTGDIDVLLDIGLCLANMGQYEDARNVYLKLLELDPSNKSAQFNCWHILIYFKDFQKGWLFFHSRLQRPEIKKNIRWYGPQWSGEPLVGKTVLIWPEQGIGDNLFYSSCFSEAVADARHCYILCDTRLKALYEYNFPNATILSKFDLDDLLNTSFEIDIQILAGSLSYLYRSSMEQFKRQKCLKLPIEQIKSIADRLSVDKIKVGISWFHGKVNDHDEYSMFLEELVPLLQIEGVEWVNLQFGDWAKEASAIEAKHGIVLRHWQDCTAEGDFIDYGELINNLDLVIAPSNAAFMYSARLGVKTWLFTPTPAYEIDEDDINSLWYEDIKQFCKGENDDWNSVVHKLCRELNGILLPS